MSQLGQSLPGPANSKSGHVPCASKAGVNSELGASATGLCGRAALGMKSSRRPIEKWHGATITGRHCSSLHPLLKIIRQLGAHTLPPPNAFNRFDLCGIRQPTRCHTLPVSPGFNSMRA
jgi:hypothetical protein